MNTQSTIRYGRGKTCIGSLWLAWTKKGLCRLSLADETPQTAVVKDLRQGGSEVVEDSQTAGRFARQIDDVLRGNRAGREVSLDLQGTPFQQRVWKELLRVPRGKTISYAELARRAGKPRAVRAAASACARNPVALVVPCHRVISSDGSLGGFGWGLDRKKKLLEMEQTGA